MVSDQRHLPTGTTPPESDSVCGPTVHVSGVGWVLPSGTGSGAAFFDLQPDREAPGPDAGILAGFSAKPYLRSVKGYLDPAAAYVLAAASLAIEQAGLTSGAGIRDDAGVVTLTALGALTSQYRFLEQLATKGPRLASPLVFPHGYSNTAGNLLAIELGFGGPHMVFYGEADWSRALIFAAAALESGAARHMIVAGYEAIHPAAVPEDRAGVVNGAVAVVLQGGPGGVAVLDRTRLYDLMSGTCPPDAGAVAGLAKLLRSGVLQPVNV